MNNKVQQFLNEVFGEVRAFKDTTEMAWFHANDVLSILEYAESGWRKKISRLNQKGVTKRHILTNGGIQEMNFINEPNLYLLVFGSKMDKAEEFQDWICTNVIPVLRKDGMYVDGEENANTLEEFNDLMNDAYERKVLRKYGVSVRKDLTTIIKNNIETNNPYIFSTITDQLIYKPLFNKTAKQLKEFHNVKKLRDDLFSNDELVKLAKQEEFIGNLIEKIKDYHKVKEIVYMN